MTTGQPALPGLRPPLSAGDPMTTDSNTSAPNGLRDSRGQYNTAPPQGHLNAGAPTYGSGPGDSLPFQGLPPFPAPNSQNAPNLAWNQQNNMNGNLNPNPSFAQLPFFMPNVPNANGDNTLQPPFMPFGPGQHQFNMPNFPLLNNFFPMDPVANPLPFLPPPPFPGLPLPGPMNFFPSFPLNHPPAVPGSITVSTLDGTQEPVNALGQNTARRSRSRSPPPPEPTQTYLKQASSPLKKLPSPQPLLVILDLNGTLIYRKSRKYPPSFAKRAGVDEFLDALLKRYKVMIWSSSQPHTVKGICEKLFPAEKRKELVVEWGRDMFGLSKSQYSAKTQVYKKLKVVWSSQAVQASYPGAAQSQPQHRGGKPKGNKQKVRRWDQSNTILIDDSKLKALTEPWNILEIPEFTNAPEVDESDIFPSVLSRLETLSSYDDVSKVFKLWESNPKDPSIISPNNNLTPVDTQATLQSEPPSTSTQAEKTENAQARKELLKARQRERKAARQQAKQALTQEKEQKKPKRPAVQKKKAAQKKAAEAAAAAAANQPAAADVLPTATSTPPVAPVMQLQETNRSPSPVSSTPSDNYLLDRLEESLDARKIVD